MEDISIYPGSNFSLKFVLPPDICEDAISENLKKAFKQSKEKGIDPEWIKSENILTLTNKSEDVFVCDPFEGRGFDYLQKLGCQIIGPLVVSMSLESNKPLPRRPIILHNLVMRGITLTFSGIAADKRKMLINKVSFMGGIYTSEFTKSVTHLVTEKHTSEKYQVAANFKLPVFLPTWIDACWDDRSSEEPKLANHPIYKRHSLKPFHMLKICATQLSSDERKQISSLVFAHGGQYSGDLNVNNTTHLVADHPEGSKYVFAQKNNLICVKQQWIYDSAKAGYYLNTKPYEFEKKPKKPKESTPVKDLQIIGDTLIGDFSAISCDKENINTLQNETIMSNCTITLNNQDNSGISETGYNSLVYLPRLEQRMSLSELDILNIDDYSMNEGFLDGLKIFVTGFFGSQLEKLYKIINMGGGTRATKLGSGITHIVVRDSQQVLALDLKQDFDGCIVHVNWLVDCLKTSSRKEERNYYVSEAIWNPPAKFMSVVSGNSDMLEHSPWKTITGNHTITNSPCKEFNALTKEKQPEPKLIENVEVEVIEDDETAQEDGLLFSGLYFIVLVSNDAEEIAEYIVRNGGNVVNDCDNSHYVIVPLIIYEDFILPKSELIVTNLWLQMSLECNEILPIGYSPLFSPIKLQQSVISKCPLKSCVITFSQFTHTEKDGLMYLAEILGAVCQDYFIKTARPTENLLPSTHLVLSTAEGKKYEAAKKWGVHAITCDWLFASTMGRAKEEEYLVDQITIGAKSNISAQTAPVTPCNKGNSNSPKLKEKPGISSSKLHAVSTERPAGAISKIKKPVRTLSFLNPALSQSSLRQSNFDTPVLKKKRYSSEVSLFKDLISKLPEEKDNSYCKMLNKIEPNLPAIPKRVRLYEGPFIGVMIFVSKKIAKEEVSLLHEAVLALGGDYSWGMDTKHCTHLIYRGKVSGSLLPELKWAKNNGKQIVSPDWVFESQKQGQRLNEERFPYSYNPRLSICSQIEVDVAAQSSMPTTEIMKLNIPSTSTSDKLKKLDLSSLSSSPTKERHVEEVPSSVNRDISKKQMEYLASVANSARLENLKRTSSANMEAPIFKSKNLPEVVVGTQPVLSEPSQQMESIPIVWDDRTEHYKHLVDGLSKTEQLPKKNICSPEKSLEVRKRFAFSGATDDEKNIYSNKLQALLGDYLSSSFLVTSATHVIMFQVLKTEKLLSAIANGCYVLDKSYLDDSFKAKCFLDEDAYEFGNPNFLHSTVKVEKKDLIGLTTCPYRWRMAKKNSNVKAFNDWEVLLFNSPKKRDMYKRVLEAGGAKILNHANEMNEEKQRFAFIDKGKSVLHNVDFKSLTSAGVFCLQPEFFSVYLINNEEPSIKSYIVNK